MQDVARAPRENLVQHAEVVRVVRRDGEALRRQRLRHRLPDSLGEGVRPVLRPVEPHGAVVWVEDEVRSPDHHVGAQGHHHPACAGVPADAGNGQVVERGEDLEAHVVHRVLVVPTLLLGVRGDVDRVKIDAVAEVPRVVGEDAAARDHDDRGLLSLCMLQARDEPAAGRRAHRPVVELEQHHTYVATLLVDNVLEGQVRHRGDAHRQLLDFEVHLELHRQCDDRGELVILGRDGQELLLFVR
mmetsp:Transcript_25000/g.70422  ORF Transcript_25000/g.70422 Transcript_25000/m.70422 type:complete len:243 (+) Transcript_25000:416-1144(+)